MGRRGEILQPLLVVVEEARLVVVDEDGGGDVHGVDQTEALGHAALQDRPLDVRRNVDEAHAGRDLESQIAGERFHGASLARAVEGRGQRRRGTAVSRSLCQDMLLGSSRKPDKKEDTE
jgi:hypothetical protein